MKKPAHRGATAGLSNAVLAVSEERYAPTHAPRQATRLARRYGLTLVHAALIVELANPTFDSWGAQQ